MLRLLVEYILLSTHVPTAWVSSDRHTRKKLNNLIPKSQTVIQSKTLPSDGWFVFSDDGVGDNRSFTAASRKLI